MASDLGSLEEFFDFARLESDNENAFQAECLEESSEQAFPAAHPAVGMEWQPSTFDAYNDLTHLPINTGLDTSESGAPSGPLTQAAHSLPVADLLTFQPHNALATEGEGAMQWVPSNQTLPRETSTQLLLPTTTVSESSPTPHALIRQFKPQPLSQPRRSTTRAHKPASAKRKGPQTRIPLETRQILEDEFATNPYPCNWEIDIIAHQVNLDVKQVRNWFNNTRARKKGSRKCHL